ncbi:E3 SUMO-protein ligase ZBED1-like [Phymastichus coffea]|uniref:E3 SUMO-protein ligase ZBED1-like n=1 Tax=Phymastichus coffea TaxID=108790 RepID=UPI00273C74B8|nr:E3 SUMO-protein ligase ZBED1-like [Phymastichus coffea]
MSFSDFESGRTRTPPPNTTRFSIYVKLNDVHLPPFSIDDLNLQDYLRLKRKTNNDSFSEPLKALSPSTSTHTSIGMISHGDDFNYESVVNQNDVASVNQNDVASVSNDSQTKNKTNEKVEKHKSGIWNHATKVKDKDGEYLKCSYCFKKFKDCGNTSNMIKHLTNVHPLLYNPTQGKSPKNVVSTGTSNSLKRKATTTMVNSVQSSEKRCTSFTPNISTAFKKIESFQGGKKAEDLTNAVLFMICKGMRPISIVECEGFRYLMRTVAPLYKVPSAKTITRRLEARYAVLHKAMVDKLKEITSYSLTADIWTDQSTKSYLGVTIHYFDVTQNDSEMQSFRLGCVPLHEPLITDGGANISKAAEDLVGKDKHIICLVHRAAHILPDSIDSEKQLDEIICKLKTIITSIRKCGPASDELIKGQQEDIDRHKQRSTEASGDQEAIHINETPLKIIQDMDTRFTSTVDMIERYLLLENYMYNALKQVKNGRDPLNRREVEVLSDVLNIMIPIRQIITDLSTEKHATCNLAIPMVNCMVHVLEEYQPSTAIGKSFKDIVLMNVQKRLSYLESTPMLAAATILDPRFKKLHFQKIQCASRTLTKINKLLQETVSSNNGASMKAVSSRAEPLTSSSNIKNIWSYHTSLINSQQQKQQDAHFHRQDIQKYHWELEHYMHAPLADNKENILIYWKKNSAAYPELSKIALQKVTILATSIPCERLFSLAGNIKNDLRNRLTGMHLNMLTFLSSFGVADW